MLKFTLGEGETALSPRGNDSLDQTEPQFQIYNFKIEIGALASQSVVSPNPGLMHEGD